MAEFDRYCSEVASGWAPSDVLTRGLSPMEIAEVYEKENNELKGETDDRQREMKEREFTKRWYLYLTIWLTAADEWESTEKERKRGE